MGDSLATFRDLKGIGPATEARLHETGIYTWEALAVAATALAAVRGEGDTLRDVANAVAARRAEAEERGAAVGLPDGNERLESFLVRVAINANGAPQRSEVTHVRTMAEQAWSGWSPGELATFIQEHSGVGGAPPRMMSRRATTKPRHDRAAGGRPLLGLRRPRITSSSSMPVRRSVGRAATSTS